ncbi:hypothetical protein SKAU_G00262040 [Synaphobranchus kaupii]|uniref:Ig-like domain-containing protein n=1 Tax=Synaphobranchus kaupii TaxID=118154 RepID=A0A9Q1EYT5_SYNKA|nr:hypothetical protein SKAU_G00262040 [Synaphobranchus kaupii]
MNTATSEPAQEPRFHVKLHRHAVLYMDYPPEDKASPVIEVEWRKHGDQHHLILKHQKSNSTFFGGYCNRTRYYFKNNTLILDSIIQDDEGVYEVSLVYKNNSEWSMKLHLFLIHMLFSIVPPPDPSIKVDMNNSQAMLVLRCEVESGIDLSYHWLKNGQPLPQDERHSLVEGNSTLQVNNLTRADCVNYTCVAANDLDWSKGHIQLNGSVMETCSVSAASALTLKTILSIAVAAFCAFGVCVLILCIRRHQEIWQWLKGRNSNEQPANSRRGQRRVTNEDDVIEYRVYDEIWEEQISPEAQEAVQLECVYTAFIPDCPGAGSIQRPVQIEDFGYSTINTLGHV